MSIHGTVKCWWCQWQVCKKEKRKKLNDIRRSEDDHNFDNWVNLHHCAPDRMMERDLIKIRYNYFAIMNVTSSLLLLHKVKKKSFCRCNIMDANAKKKYFIATHNFQAFNDVDSKRQWKDGSTHEMISWQTSLKWLVGKFKEFAGCIWQICHVYS